MMSLGIVASGRTASGLTVSYVSDAIDITNQYSYSFSISHSGTTSDVIVIGVAAEDAAATSTLTLSSATFNGTGTSPAAVVNGAGISSVAALFAVTGYAPGTYTFTVLFNRQCARAAAGWWRLSGGASTTAKDSGSWSAASGTGLTGTVDVAAGQVAFAMYCEGTANAVTWTGATGDFYEAPEGATTGMAGASVSPTGTARNGHSIQVSHSFGAQPLGLAVAVFGT